MKTNPDIPKELFRCADCNNYFNDEGENVNVYGYTPWEFDEIDIISRQCDDCKEMEDYHNEFKN